MKQLQISLQKRNCKGIDQKLDQHILGVIQELWLNFVFCLAHSLLRRASQKPPSEIIIKVDKKYCGRTYWMKEKKKKKESYNYLIILIRIGRQMEKHYCQLRAACSPVLCHGVLLHLLSEAKDLPLCCLLRLLISTLDTSHYEVPKSLHVSNHLNWKVNNNLQKIVYSL